MNEPENAYASLKLENEQLRQENHQLNNELTVARLALGQLTDGHKYSAKVCEIAWEGLGTPDRPIVLPQNMEEFAPDAGRSLRAELEQYSATPSREFSELAWHVLIDNLGPEHTAMVHELCSRASPEWLREVRIAAKTDPTPSELR